VEPDRLDPRLRLVVQAVENPDERLLVLLFVKKAEPVDDLAEMLASPRADVLGALGRLAQAKLVAHHRPEEGGAIHWFATAEGRVRGEQAYRATAARLVAEAKAAPPAPEPEPAEEPKPAAPDHERVKTRRRVSIDQNERGGFSWDT
jgi:hypothetical protein